jgi:hypothetical protein
MLRRCSKAVLPIVGALALLLSGCGMFQREDPRPCPRVAILSDASLITLYRPGEGRDLTDIAYEARITRLSSRCAYRGDKLRSEVKIEILAERGPGAEKRQTSLPFFVSIVGRNGEVRAKEIFDSAIEFEKGRRRTGIFEEIEQFIELRSEESGADYEIIVGFQLNREQLELNRKRRL